MPRKQRFYIPGIPAHVMQRGHNRNPIFFNDLDYLEYLKILKKVVDKYECQIHAYMLMTNHVHLLLTPSTSKSISLLFQSLGRMYVSYINTKYQRSGTLWEGRHKGNVVESDSYFLTCMKYIELNPVRAHMVECPSDCPWSSYSSNGKGKYNVILTEHEVYSRLADNQSDRLKAYNDLFDIKLNSQVLSDLENSIQSGTPLGSDSFMKNIEETLSCHVGYIKPGRPSRKGVKREGSQSQFKIDIYIFIALT